MADKDKPKGGDHSGKPDTADGDGHRDKAPGETRPYDPKKDGK